MRRRRIPHTPHSISREVRLALYDRKLTLVEWCRAHGWKENTVRELLRRHEANPDRVPHGKIAVQICHALEDELGIAIVKRAA